MNDTLQAMLAQMGFSQALQLLGFVVVLFSLCVHESAHALTSHWGGDDTAKSLGRITLNPVSHIDPFGTIILPLLSRVSGVPIIGWAKPVPFVASKLRSSLWIVWVAGAGPFSNVLLALVSGFWLKILGEAFDWALPEPILIFLHLFIVINLGLAVFNMIPIPPLDGSKFLFHFVF